MNKHLYNCKEYLKLTENQTETPFIKKSKNRGSNSGGWTNKYNKYTVGKI